MDSQPQSLQPQQQGPLGQAVAEPAVERGEGNVPQGGLREQFRAAGQELLGPHLHDLQETPTEGMGRTVIAEQPRLDRAEPLLLVSPQQFVLAPLPLRALRLARARAGPGSGTQSGPDPSEAGSLLELTGGGKQPLTLPGGETRTFLEDGDCVIFRAW